MKMNFALQSAKIVGTPSSSRWSQTHCFSSEESEKKEKRGDLLAVLVIQGLGDGIEAVAAGREILGRLHEEYYGNLEGSAFERLGEAVKKVCQEQGGVEIVAAALVGEVIYLAVFGKGKILLKREDKLGVVLEGGGDLVTASGFIKDNDLIILGSEKFFRVIENKILKLALENSELDQAVELLAPAILGQSEMADAAAILGLFEEVQEEIQTEEVPSLFPPPSFKNRIFVRNKDFASKKRFYFILSLVLLVILGLGFIFGIKKSYEAKKETEVKALLSQAEEKFNQARAVFVTDPGKGRLLAEEAKSITQKAIGVKEGFAETELIKKQIEDFLSSSQSEIVLNDTPTFMDLNLIQDGAGGVSLSVIDKNLVILDPNKKKVYLLDYEKKSHTVFDISGEGGNLTTVFGSKVIVFSSKGVEEVNPQNKAVSLKISKDVEWKEIAGMASFGQNLYLLDRGGSNLWRYAANGDEFGAKKGWFVGDRPDLSKAVCLAIDGSVWILEEDNILKFNLGKQESFVLSKMPASPQGGPESFGNPVKIYTSTETQNLYVLDKSRGKIFVIAKNGEFKIAYSGEEIKQAEDLVAIESLKKIFLLSRSKIYEVGLR